MRVEELPPVFYSLPPAESASEDDLLRLPWSRIIDVPLRRVRNSSCKGLNF